MDSVLSKSSGEVAAVKRAQIIQRVLVDGWSPAQTAAVFAVPERRIARWVEDYRRRGMASLRDEVPGERVHQRWLHALTGAVSSPVRRAKANTLEAQCREALSAEAFARAWEEGVALDADAAADWALRLWEETE